jgi:quercetin 2,3-dioxygenase
MLAVRRADERGRSEMDWLDSRHTFSFADYDDPKYRGFRALRVINEDRVRGGSGFGAHPHRDMEIISYVLEGALEHKDSMGTGSVIGPGDVQRMSAGTGVVHSEWNHSKSDPVHFLQIWIIPERGGLPPSYEQKRVSDAEKHGRLRLVGARDGGDGDGAITIHQDVRLYAALLDEGDSVTHAIPPGRRTWVQIVRGAVALDGDQLKAGDGAAITEADAVALKAESAAELLLFDLA